jgi:TLC domain
MKPLVVIRAERFLHLISLLWSEYYNSEETFWPLYIPLTVWVSAFVWCRIQGREFHKWYTIHNLHNAGAIALGTISIYAGNHPSAITFHERIPILWSLGYFAVDLVDCTIRRDAAYFMHALVCFTLGLGNFHTPILRQLRMNSKATYCELSNPFMHLAKRTRNPLHFTLFAVVFTACRMVWIPVLYRQLLVDGGLASTHPIVLVLIAFYALNAYWWLKILRILYEGLVLKQTPSSEGTVRADSSKERPKQD